MTIHAVRLAIGSMPNLRFVAIQEQDGCWSAQALEYDLAAQADSLESLPAATAIVCRGHVVVSEHLGRQPLEGLGKAPDWYFRLHANAPPFVISDGL